MIKESYFRDGERQKQLLIRTKLTKKQAVDHPHLKHSNIGDTINYHVPVFCKIGDMIIYCVPKYFG